MGRSSKLDEIALKRAIQQADKVQKTIDAHKDVWDDLDADIWKMWKATKSDAKETREDLFREHHAIQAIQARLQRAVNEGRKADEELKQQQVKHGNRSRT